MDRFNYYSHSIGDYYSQYSQIHQEDGQYTSQPETGQTYGGVAASGPSWSHPPAQGQPQPYQGANFPAQIPPSPGQDWESILRSPQPMALEDIIHSQIYLEDGQYSSQPETGHTSTGGPASGPWWSLPAPGQLQPHQGFNFPVQIPPLPGSDLGLEYLQQSLQPMVLEDTIQNEAPLSPPNAQPAVEALRRWLPVKKRFLAGLEAFGRGVPLRYCASSFRFSNYINDDGSMTYKGESLYRQFTDKEKTLLKQAIIARQGSKSTKAPVEERFLAGLDNYAQGVPLIDCSETLPYRVYVSDTGQLQKSGTALYNRMSAVNKGRVNQALASRKEFCLNRAKSNTSVERRFLAGLDNYARGVSLADCSADIQFEDYVTDDGNLHKDGEELRAGLSPEEQTRIDQALLSRSKLRLTRSMDLALVEERFLASLDNYARGVLLSECAEDIHLHLYLTDDGRLQEGQSLYNSLSPDDKVRVNRALAARRRMAAEGISGDVDQFMKTLEPYGNGQPLQDCGTQSGLMEKAIFYFTPEGGLTPSGELLIENLPPDQKIDVVYAIEKRRRHINPSAQVPGSPWLLPEIPASMPEMGGMDPTAMVAPMQTETMMAAAWQYTGQAMPGIWGMPSEPAEPPIPFYNSEAFGDDFQHQYGLYADQYPGRGV
jgi:hypothetical protein